MSVLMKDVERKTQQELGYKCSVTSLTTILTQQPHDGQFLTKPSKLQETPVFVATEATTVMVNVLLNRMGHQVAIRAFSSLLPLHEVQSKRGKIVVPVLSL